MTWKIAASALFMTASLAGAAEPALPLWPGVAPGSENAAQPERITTGANGDRVISQIASPTLTPFYAEHPNGTAIIVSPGSGFRAEAFDAEGVAVAQWLNTLGVDAFVLKYRLPSEGHVTGEDVMVQDVQRAIRLVRGLTVRKPRRVGTLGFSAGGNLTAISAVYYDRIVYAPVDTNDALSARPDFFAVIYGYVPRPEDLNLVHMPPDSPTVRYLAKYPFEPAVSADTPPCFVIHGDSDHHVSAEHGMRIATAVAKVGGRCEFHLIKGADHGFGLRAIGEDRIWPSLFAEWLAKQN